MFDFIKDNLQNIVLVIGAVAILFWPQVSAAIKAARGNGETPSTVPPANNNHSGCNCCCPEEPPHDDAPKSEWVVRQMEIRAYCLEHRLTEGVELSEKLCAVLVASRPDKPEKAVVMVKKETR